MKIMICPTSSSLYIRLLTKYLVEQGVEVSMIPWFGKQSPLSLMSLLKAIRDSHTILHLHWMPFNWRFMMSYVRGKCEKSGVKAVWTIHNLIPHMTRFGSINNDLEAMRYMADWADYGIVHSHNVVDLVRVSFGKNLPLSVIPHGHFIDYVERIPRDEARRNLGIPEDKIVLLMFPPNRWNKGLTTFTEVLEELPDSYMGVMAGKCTDRKILRYLYDRQKKLGRKLLLDPTYVPTEKAHQYFGSADAFFMPYEDITTSGSVAHAISYGKAVISTPRGNLEEMVKDGVNGHLCESRSEMAEAILSLTPENTQEMGERSFEVAKTFDWKDIASKTISVYERVAE